MNRPRRFIARLPSTQENTTTKVTQATNKDGPVESVVLESESNVTVEKDLVSQAEEEDIEALLSK